MEGHEFFVISVEDSYRVDPDIAIADWLKVNEVKRPSDFVCLDLVLCPNVTDKVLD